MGKKKAGSKSKSKVQVKPVKPAKVVAVSPVKPSKVVAVSPVKPAKVVSPAKQAKVEEIPEKQPEVEIEIEESKKAGRPVKNEYSEKEALAYVQRYLNKKLGLGPNVIPSRDNILEFGKKHGIISSSESSKNLAKLTAKHISRFIFAYAKKGLTVSYKKILGSTEIFYERSELDKNLEEIEKHGPRAYSMKFIFDQLKLNYTEEDEEDAEEEEKKHISRKTIKQLMNEFNLNDTEYENAQIKGDIDDSLKYIEHFRNIYANFQEIPDNIKRDIMSSKIEAKRLTQYNQMKSMMEKYFTEKKQIFPIPKIEDRDKLINRASMFYNTSASQAEPTEIKGDELPLFKLSLPAINLADAKSSEVRAELEAEKKAAEDINKQIDMFTIQNIGSNKIQNYNEALISAGMTGEEDRKRAIRRVFFTAIQAKLKDEIGAIVKIYKLEGTTIEKDIKNMLEKQTQPSMIEEFDPLAFLTKAKQYISVVTETKPSASGVEEGKLLNEEEKELINKPLEILQDVLKEENNVIQLNKRIIKAKIEEAIKFHDGSLEPVLNPSMRRINNLPDNIIPVISKPDIHGDERRVLCNYGTSYN